MTLPADSTGTPFDTAAVRADFPLLNRQVNDHPIVYLDSAATSQKPRLVIDTLNRYYEEINANVHRGAYHIAELATSATEDARARIQRFIGAPSANEVIFTKNATEAINLVAYSWGRENLGEGDAVLITALEHHANIVPWQQLASERGVEIRWLPLTDDGRLDLTDLDQLLDGVSLFAFSAASNVLGTLTPVRQLADAAHAAGALCLVDGSQAVPHLPTDVAAWTCDFMAFTGHKMCGPTGIGVLWGRSELLDAMPPFLGGGEMILNVTREGFVPNELPWKFEAGTPPIAEIIGLGAAVSYLEAIGMDAVRTHESLLTDYALRTLNERHGDDLVIHGPTDAGDRGGVLSICYRDVHPHDLSQVLDQRGVCVRAGHHCAKPLMKLLGVGATARASVYIYNNESDVDVLSDALAEAGEFFSHQPA
ncbi:MAG: SufS family cysteine desulfurase [Acidimicrobiales bacterium]|jgi:cysteine desulfurase/selenocysteine lyase|nr:SufS family cysteine desulfurase [Acidimicrobiales bacterium]|tara:strand:- start:4052 stop:5320 length:1269 start_codon:yes stop_codon:yes gene_type:complete